MNSPTSDIDADNASAEPKGFREALSRYISATNTHDFDTVLALLHPDVVFRFSDTDCDTIAAARRYFETAWATVIDELYEAVDISWRLPSPTTAIASYRYRWSGLVGGEPRSGGGRATNVFVADSEGRWLLAHEHLTPGP